MSEANDSGTVSEADHRRVVIEADGASRGNPGPAAYGAADQFDGYETFDA